MHWKNYPYINATTTSLKPVVGISACLLGDPVRYDGKHKKVESLITAFSPYVDWEKTCPESEAGLGTPRPPVQLVQKDTLIVQGVNDPDINVTKPLLKMAEDFPSLHPRGKKLCGFILKARSPSCGTHTTPIFNEELELTTLASGIFSQQIQNTMPWLPIYDEEILKNKRQQKLALLSFYLLQDFYLANQSAIKFVEYHTEKLSQILSDEESMPIITALNKLKT